MGNFDRIRVGLIGYGIGKVYAATLLNLDMYKYTDLPPIDLVAVATSSSASGELAKQTFGFQWHTTDYRTLLASEEVNAVIIATPHYLHRDMLIDALHTDKAIYADKPLANNLAEAREITARAEELGRTVHVGFTVRHTPVLQYVKQILQAGRLGRIYSFRASYYRSSYGDSEKSLRWKAHMATGGGGVLNDLVPHLSDLIIWLLGTPERLVAQTRTFISERPLAPGSVERTRVDTDDHVIIQAELPDGILGTIESGRLMTGLTNEMQLEIYGSSGFLRCNPALSNMLYLEERGAGEHGWRQIPNPQPYPEKLAVESSLTAEELYPYTVGMHDFIRRTQQGQSYSHGLQQGLLVQAVTEAALRSASSGMWVDVAHR